MDEIGKRIKELRLEANITQNTLASILKVTQDSISLWENGKRIPDTQYIIVMAKYFDVSSDYILGISDDFTAIRLNNENRVKEWLTREELKIIENYRKNKKQT